MRRVQVPVDLPAEAILFLWELANQKHCTLADMIDYAVVIHAKGERRRRVQEIVKS